MISKSFFKFKGKIVRSHYNTDLSTKNIGEEVRLCGWANSYRDHGGIIFIDLRDRSGLIQLVCDPKDSQKAHQIAESVRNEFVLIARGKVRARGEGLTNAKLKTGEIEVVVDELVVESESPTPPFEIGDENVNEELRLKYRFLDLRNPKLYANFALRSKACIAARNSLANMGFLEVETPILTKATPEGARDYLVPSRVHQGEFYALPQSPQLFKQLLMCAGFDRYFQIAKCFRDEDLRADRQPEFTQIDVEMSFCEQKDIMQVAETFLKDIFKACGKDISTPFRIMQYSEAMEKYGSDKPDLRFGMEIFDLSDIVKDCGFSVFSSAVAGGGSVRGITAKNAVGTFTRKELDKLTEHAKGIGAKGLAWIRLTDDGVSSSFAKFMSEDEMKAILERAGAEKGDVVMIIADTKNSTVLTTLGALRSESGKRLGIIGDGYELLWIVEFPFFDWDEETKTFVAMHHPFTAPLDECLPYLETDKASVRAKAYDLVLNGIELSSGSIRITDPELQSRIFTLLGLSDEEAYSKFGYLLDAFRFGPPPHGGMGIGLDRLVMQLIKADSLRDVIAFPKVQNASEPMTECPAAVDKVQLDDLGIELKGE